MHETRWRAILNAAAAGDADLRSAILHMRDRGTDLDVRVCWEAGDAERYVNEALEEGVLTIVVAGGDGTLGEVASTLARSRPLTAALPVLGVVPAGTANDFAAAANVPADPAAALPLIATVPAVPIDLLRVRYDQAERWSVNFISGGFVTQATAQAPDGLKKRLGKGAYLLTGLAKLDDLEPVLVRIEGASFAWEGPLIALGIGNGRQAGGGHILCPDAELNDGILDVVVAPQLTGKLGTVFATWLARGKDAALEEAVHRARLECVTIHAPKSIVLNLDGEPMEADRFVVECVPNVVRMHLPPDCPLLAQNAHRELDPQLARAD